MGKTLAVSPLSDQSAARRIGEIRIGERAVAQSGSQYPRGRETFRFTSLSHSYLADVQAVYGGDLRRWNDKDHPGWWELSTDANEIHVVVDRRNALDQEYVQFTAAGKSHGCDGVTCNLFSASGVQEVPCPCDPLERQCKLRTQLTVLLPDVAIALWRITSHSKIFSEQVHEFFGLLEWAGATSQVLPCLLQVARGEKKVPGKKPERYSYPVLGFDRNPPSMAGLLEESQRRLMGSIGSALNAEQKVIEQPETEQKALAAPAPDVATDTEPPQKASIDKASDEPDIIDAEFNDLDAPPAATFRDHAQVAQQSRNGQRSNGNGWPAPEGESELVCRNERCGTMLTVAQAKLSQNKYGRQLCPTCQKAERPAQGVAA